MWGPIWWWEASSKIWAAVWLRTGGYVCGRQDLIDRCAYRLSAPGLGKEVGAILGPLTSFYQGLFWRLPQWWPLCKGCYLLQLDAMKRWASGPRQPEVRRYHSGGGAGQPGYVCLLRASGRRTVDSYVTPGHGPCPATTATLSWPPELFVQGPHRGSPPTAHPSPTPCIFRVA